jgi:NADPH:quinone reductase-like Zn-dependent oxidoreductase
MQTMQAVRIERFGGPDVLHIEKISIPEPHQGEILLKVHAASVNPVDYKIRSGKYSAVKSDKLPYVLGRDVSGVVEKLGPSTTGFAKGDALYGVPGIDRGAYAEHVILKVSEVARKPETLNYAEAAAVPLAALTAWQGLFRHGGLQSGHRVLIHGGSGGVGHFAIQFAKAKGAFVATTVSEKHIDFVRRLGADEIIDYKPQRFEDEVRGVDMVFDLIGGETQERSWNVLKKGGILVSTLTQPSPEKAKTLGVRGTRYTVEENGSELKEIAALIDAGKVFPHLEKTFVLSEAAEAQRVVETGHTQGKVVLTVSA